MRLSIFEFQLALMGLLAPMSAHAKPSTRHPIVPSEKGDAHVFKHFQNINFRFPNQPHVRFNIYDTQTLNSQLLYKLINYHYLILI